MLNNIGEIGKRIREEREAFGMKQQALASEAKIDTASLSRYENGKQEPNLETIVKIAQVLNLSLDYLIFGEKKERLFSKTKEEEKARTWAEVVCYALATLIETKTIVIDTNVTSKGLVCNLEKNRSVLEFFDKMLKLGELRDSLSDEHYESAKINVINEYQSKIMDSYSKLANPSSYYEAEEARNNGLICDQIFKQILKNHKKISD